MNYIPSLEDLVGSAPFQCDSLATFPSKFGDFFMALKQSDLNIANMDETGFMERNAGAPAFGSAVPVPDEDIKISIIQDASLPHCATFQLKHEDHTLGNALRYLLMKDRDVDFAGYAIPHPSKPVIHLHVQTKGIPASDAFERSLRDFDRIGTHMLDSFRANLQSFKGSAGMDMD